jgi:hypothetical protein
MATKRFIQMVWLQPAMTMNERFDRDRFKVTTEDGYTRLKTSDGELVRIIPTHRIQLVQFGEEQIPDMPQPVIGTTEGEDVTEEIPAHLPDRKPEA